MFFHNILFSNGFSTLSIIRVAPLKEGVFFISVASHLSIEIRHSQCVENCSNVGGTGLFKELSCIWDFHVFPT